MGKRPRKFHIYIDDSGHFKSLLNFAGEVQHIPDLLPLGVVSAVVIPDDIHDELLHAWLELKAKITRQITVPLGVPTPIHQRLMWGNDVRHTFRLGGKHTNPYFHMTMEERLHWVEETRKVVSKFSVKQPGIYGCFYCIDNHDMAQTLGNFFKSTYSLEERKFIRKSSEKIYDIYHKVVTNPLVNSYAQILFLSYRSISCKYLKNFSVDIYFDRNPDAKGFEVLTAFRILKRRGHLEHIENLIPSGWDTHPLIEVADFYAYWTHREKHLKKVGSSDLHLNRWNTCFPLRYNNVPVNSNVTEYREMQMCVLLHFELARMRMQEINGAFTDEHIVSVDQFCQALEHPVHDGTFGYPILKASPQRLIRNANGDVVPMTRAGITPGPSEDSISLIGKILQPQLGLLR